LVFVDRTPSDKDGQSTNKKINLPMLQEKRLNWTKTMNALRPQNTAGLNTRRLQGEKIVVLLFKEIPLNPTFRELKNKEAN
jgi:hypothetical protein